MADSRARVAATAMRERQRLEAELHDSAQNRLIALLIRLGLARDKAEQTSPELAATLDALIEDTQAVGVELRRIAHGILPPLLASDGLAAALRAEGAHSTIAVRVAAGDVGRSEQGIELAVYLCCLESIQNAAKHAGRNASVTVTLRREADELMFSVHDAGRGFDQRATPRGAGLTSVHDRATPSGGASTWYRRQVAARS